MIFVLRLLTIVVLLVNALTICAGHEISTAGGFINALFAGANIIIIAIQFEEGNIS